MIQNALSLVASLALLAAAAPAQAGGNPLSRPPAAVAADPLARTFANDELSLMLHKVADGYTGQLSIGGGDYPVTAAATAAGALRGSFKVGEDVFAFTATLDGDVLTLRSDGASHELRARTPAPLATGAHAAPPPLVGVFDGKTVTYRHPEGYFTLELPDGWVQANAGDGAVLFNPGLQPTDTLDCILIVTFGELEVDERGVAITELLDGQEAQMRQQMQAQQIALQPAKAKATKVLVGELPGAEQTWQGTAGGHPVVMWVGATTVREYYFAVMAVVVQGKEPRFMPGVKRMFRSVQPKPPLRDRVAEAALAGSEFTHSETFSGGSTFTTFAFRADGTVNRRIMMSGRIGISTDVGADAGDDGRFEVVGPLVYLRFKDGQQVARIERDGDAVAAIGIGKARYRRR